MIKSLAIIFCVAVGVQSFPFNLQLPPGSCPYVVPDSVEGVEGRWYGIYTSYSGMQYVNCVYGDIVSLGNDTFQLNFVFDVIKGVSLPFKTTVEKEDDGKYYYTWEPIAGVAVKSLMMIKVEGDFLLTWTCDAAAVYSKNKETSEDAKKTFLEYLKDKGSKVTELYEIPYKNCPA